MRPYSRMPIGVQLCHAGRKAASHRPFVGKGPLKEGEGAWPVIGPSPVPFADGWQTSSEMSLEDMDTVLQAFVERLERRK